MQNINSNTMIESNCSKSKSNWQLWVSLEDANELFGLNAPNYQHKICGINLSIDEKLGKYGRYASILRTMFSKK